MVTHDDALPVLSDDEIVAIAREAARGSAIRRDGMTSLRVGRAVEQRVLAALAARAVEAREELREMGGGCSRAVAAEAERDALAALLRTIKPILVTVREGSVPLDAPLASLIAEIDALDGAKGK